MPHRGEEGPAVRIGVFTDSYHPYVSGVVRSIDTFTEELSRRGHEVFIFAPGYPGHRRRQGNVFRFFSLPAPVGRTDFALALPWSPRLGNTVGRLGLDLIHVHSPFLMGFLGARCAELHRLPLVFTYHTLYHEYVHYVPLMADLARVATLRWSRNFCDRCDLVIAPSSSVRAFLERQGIRTPIEIVPTGVRPERFQGGDPARLRQAYGLGEGPVLLYVGRLAREKNLAFLLEAFLRVAGRRPDARLVLVGGGPDEAYLREQAAALGLAGKAVFTGRLEAAELVHAYAGADVFTFPSVTETQGIVLLEAMAAGLPVVAVRATGSVDMVADGESGLLCPASVDAFAAAVAGLLDDPARRQAMAEAARERAARQSAGAMAARLEAAYQAAAQAHRYAAAAQAR